MDVKEAVAARNSIRAFSPEPVPKKILEEIMERALRAPSWGNTQPWKFTIVGGKTLEKIRGEFVQLLQKEVPPSPDYPMPTKFSEAQTHRYKGLAKDLYEALGIEREDKEDRKAFYVKMIQLFDTRCVIYLHLDKGFSPYALMDGGIILQTIALLAPGYGLGTCILAQSVTYPGVVRKYTGIHDDQVLVMGMAIGYPIQDHPANQFRSQRGKPDEFLRWIDMK